MTDHTPTPWTWHAKSIDQAHNGSIFHMKMPGHAYAIAMQPRYVDDKQFATDADFIVKAVNDHDALVARVKYLEATEANEILRLKMALEKIAAMDPKGIRADDLGRAARIAAETLLTLSAVSTEKQP